MEGLSFEESVQLRKVSEDVYQNVYEPWTWPFSKVVPGGELMAGCARAAYHTVPSDFVLDNLQCNFIGGPSAKMPMLFKVQRLSNGNRFMVRTATVEQEEKLMFHSTMTYVRSSKWTGPAMTHSRQRLTRHTVSKITLDDLEITRNRLGSFMKFQRLPLTFEDTARSVESGITTSVAQIIPPISESADPMIHLLGMLNLSDYHVMDTPLHLNGIQFGLPAIGDYSRTPLENNMKVGTSLNHSVHFHLHDGFRADELTYIEVETSWAKDGRAMLHTQIFSKKGQLIATCNQEAFYVLKKDPPGQSTAKL